MRFGFDFNDSDLLLTVIQDAYSDNIALEYVHYEGPNVPKLIKAQPRNVVSNLGDSEEDILKPVRGKKLNSRNGVETDYENVRPKSKPAQKEPKKVEEKKEIFTKPSTRRNKKLSPTHSSQEQP